MSSSPSTNAFSCTTPPPSPFTLFSKLPMELRRTIWQISILSIAPRIIPIEPDDEYEDAGRGFRCIARIGTPGPFSACSESRAEAVKIYSLMFEEQLRYPIYFSKEKDMLFMTRTTSMYSFLQSTYKMERITHEEYGREEVRHLAVLVNDSSDTNFWGEDSKHGYPSWRQVSAVATTFPNLKELRLVYRKEWGDYTPGFHPERATLEWFWNVNWLKWQRLRASVRRTQFVELSSTPDFVFWSREDLEVVLPMERWRAEDFWRRSRGGPEPLQGRNALSFFQRF